MVTLTNDKGRICVTNEVFTNLAGNAATSCFGVKGMVGRAKDSGPLQLLRRDVKKALTFLDKNSSYTHGYSLPPKPVNIKQKIYRNRHSCLFPCSHACLLRYNISTGTLTTTFVTWHGSSSTAPFGRCTSSG